MDLSLYLSLSLNTFDWQTVHDVLPDLLQRGLVFTVKLTLYSTVVGLILGTLLAMMRLSSNRIVSRCVASYVNVMRALPLIMILFWFFFLVPYVFGWIDYGWDVYILQKTGQTMQPYPLDGFSCAVIAFSLFEAAYFSEIMRAGIQAIAKGQINAGYALGLSYFQMMRLVVLPQAFRNVLPVIFTQIIATFQDTSLVTVLSLYDLLGIAKVKSDLLGRPVELYILAAVIYFVVSFVCSRGVAYMERRLRIIR